MAIGALIGGVSGGVGMGVSGLVGDGLAGGFLGGMAGGATAGGLSTAFYGGDAIENITRVAVFGAAAGFAFGAIGFPNTPWKVAAYGGIGGGLSALSGGDFAEGAIIASGIAIVGYGYYKFTNGRLPTGRLSSGEAIEKPNDPQQAMTVMKKNPDSPFMGLAAKSRDLPAWDNTLSEQSLRWIPNNIPIFNDISFMHDFFGYKIFTNPLSWKTACWPSMIPAAAWTMAGVATYYAPYTTVIVMGSHSE